MTTLVMSNLIRIDMKKYIDGIELTDGVLVIGSQNIEPLTELQLQKMFCLLQEVDGFRLGILETTLDVVIDGDNFTIESGVYDDWNEDKTEDEDDGGWGIGVEYSGTLTDLNKLNTYEDRLSDEENPMSVSFDYEVVKGKIQPCDEDTHYGRRILSDEETIQIVQKYKDMGYISDNGFGWITIYDDMVVLENNTGELLLPK